MFILVLTFLHVGLLRDSVRTYVEPHVFHTFAECSAQYDRWRATGGELYAGACVEVRGNQVIVSQ